MIPARDIFAGNPRENKTETELVHAPDREAWRFVVTYTYNNGRDHWRMYFRAPADRAAFIDTMAGFIDNVETFDREK